MSSPRQVPTSATLKRYPKKKVGRGRGARRPCSKHTVLAQPTDWPTACFRGSASRLYRNRLLKKVKGKIYRGDLRSVTMSSSDLLSGDKGSAPSGSPPRRLAGFGPFGPTDNLNYEHTVRRPRKKDGRTRLLPIRHRVDEGRSRRAPGRPRRHGPLQLAGPPGLRNGDLSCRRRRIAAASGDC
ncbi:MAG: hypothetical protein Ct9H300mP25_04050 [Acidobacteriota bacterium]|nr:MAG: hypothetical protein Ct9H300mP25_04050 [Acidobacteriota bacterium]